MACVAAVAPPPPKAASARPCVAMPQRSTLDPVLRGEVRGVDWKAVLLLAAAGLYMFATPGACRVEMVHLNQASVVW